MAAYFLDYNENNMIEWSNNALLPNESIKGSIMAVYSNVGAKISNGPFFGYFSVTDNNKILVGLTHKDINHHLSFNIDNISYIKIKKTIIGSRKVSILFDMDGEKFKLRFSFAKKDNIDFPNQVSNADIIEDILNNLKIS